MEDIINDDGVSNSPALVVVVVLAGWMMAAK